ncbi:MAG: hypothetical protein KJ063_07470 [Anaerolineae bacterium]|nr:hypothetical protein [Anaerolineae bacterium]
MIVHHVLQVVLPDCSLASSLRRASMFQAVYPICQAIVFRLPGDWATNGKRPALGQVTN